jgi:1-deoxy-D-xylulose-5-phosphate reductoisomerase
VKNISLLGSTGSIGKTTIKIIDKFSDDYRLVGLTCGNNWRLLAEQTKKLKIPPVAVAVNNRKYLPNLKDALGELPVRVLAGKEGICEVASLTQADLVLVAIVGSSALEPLLYAIKNKKNIGLANKESLVIAGGLVMEEIRKNGVRLIPVDSEHSAIAQCLEGKNLDEVKRIILTASGGPFFNYKPDMLKNVTIMDALEHPNWEMGDKITIDSATLMNKGFEVIEAHHIFDFPFSRIKVFIHPQSIVHSLVEFEDKSVLVQMAYPDMTLPVQFALTFPERKPTKIPELDLEMIKKLEFYKPDHSNFPLLNLAYKAGEEGGSAPIILNASNDIAVKGFLNEDIKFTQIASVVEETLGIMTQQEVENLEEILAIDQESRNISSGIISVYKKNDSKKR